MCRAMMRVRAHVCARRAWGGERQFDHDTLIELAHARRAWERGTANN